MTYFHYYATTSRNLDRVAQYVVFPLAHAVGWAWCKNKSADPLGDAAKFARWVSAGAYGSLTSLFFGLESDMIDANARKAVSAEMGVDPKSLEFSDYKFSDNALVKRAYEDILRLQKYRYGTDALFLLPTGIDHGYKAFTGKDLPATRTLQSAPTDKKYSAAEILLNGHMAANYSVLAGKALYWAGETYFVPKTGHYEIVKLRENLQATGKDMSPNDLLAVYQRTRNDKNIAMIERADEYDALRPLLKQMADAYNRHDGKFDIAEIVYLIGLGKINIHAADGKTVSMEAIEKSKHEIDHLLEVGLDGIRIENHRLHAHEKANPHHKSVSDHIANGAFRVAQTLIGAIRPRNLKREMIHQEEFITARDPGELTNWNYSINR